jgi:hypothetical protein
MGDSSSSALSKKMTSTAGQLCSVDSFCTERIKPWDAFIASVIIVRFYGAVLKNLTQKFNEAVLEQGRQCRLMNEQDR